MKTGNTAADVQSLDRLIQPQWSPVMKTGNTRGRTGAPPARPHASMEPGHEDREYSPTPSPPPTPPSASMEPGHEDREYE